MDRVRARLPRDCVLLPLSSGRLLVSPAHATFCPVPAAEVSLVAALLADESAIENLPAGLRDALARHGFWGPARSAPARLPSFQLQLTNACGLRCAYCCTDSGAARPREVTLEQCRQVVLEAEAAAGARCGFGLLGGEPLLVPWALDLAAYIVSRGHRLTLFTSGLPLATDAEGCRRLGALAGRGAEVRVSLAGPTRQTCDELSASPRFEAALQAISGLAAHGPAPAIDLMLLPQQVATLAQDLPRLRARLPRGTQLSLGVLYHGGREAGVHIFSTRSELEDALTRVAFETGETIPAAERAPVTSRRDGCACVLGQTLHLRSDGKLFACFKMDEQVGDLDRGSFGDTYRQLQASPRPASSIPMCSSCALVSLCGGGCRSENQYWNGCADAPVCGPWRLRVLSELLAEDRVEALHWPAVHLLAEAHRRGIEAPPFLLLRCARKPSSTTAGSDELPDCTTLTLEHAHPLEVPSDAARGRS